MTVEPDKKESQWIDINRYLQIDSDETTNYFSSLFNIFKLLFGSEEAKPICLTCKSSASIFIHKKGIYCCNEYKFDEEGKDLIRDENAEEHNIQILTPNEALNFMINEIQFYLEEPNGYVMDVYDIEYHIFKKPYPFYFETVNGEVTKGKIMKKFFMIKNFIIEELICIREKIRFSNPYLSNAYSNNLMAR